MRISFRSILACLIALSLFVVAPVHGIHATVCNPVNTGTWTILVDTLCNSNIDGQGIVHGPGFGGSILITSNSTHAGNLTMNTGKWIVFDTGASSSAHTFEISGGPLADDLYFTANESFINKSGQSFGITINFFNGSVNLTNTIFNVNDINIFNQFNMTGGELNIVGAGTLRIARGKTFISNVKINRALDIGKTTDALHAGSLEIKNSTFTGPNTLRVFAGNVTFQRSDINLSDSNSISFNGRTSDTINISLTNISQRSTTVGFANDNTVRSNLTVVFDRAIVNSSAVTIGDLGVPGNNITINGSVDFYNTASVTWNSNTNARVTRYYPIKLVNRNNVPIAGQQIEVFRNNSIANGTYTTNTNGETDIQLIFNHSMVPDFFTLRIHGFNMTNLSLISDTYNQTSGDAYVKINFTGNCNPGGSLWNVTGKVVCINEILDIDSNISVHSDANLTLRNSTFKMNASVNGNKFINTTSGAIVKIISGSNITNGNFNSSANYDLLVRSGSFLEIRDSFITNAGSPASISAGMRIEANNVNISNTTMRNNANQGSLIILVGSDANITNNTFIANGQNSKTAIDISGSSNLIYKNNITTDGFGIEVGGSSNNITQNILRASENSIRLQSGSSNTIENNNMTYTGGGSTNGAVLRIISSDGNKIIRNNIVSSTTPISGIYISLNADSNHLIDNNISVANGEYIIRSESSSKNNNLTITDQRLYANGKILLAGNVSVTGTGNLTLRNVSLILNSTANQYFLLARSGSELRILSGSNITRTDNNNYNFLIDGGSFFEARDSYINYAGTVNGIEIRANHTNITNTTIYNNVLSGTASAVSLINVTRANLSHNNITVQGSDVRALYMEWVSDSTIFNNTVKSEKMGIRILPGSGSNMHSQNNIISHNTIDNTNVGSNTEAYGIWSLSFSASRIRNNTIENNSIRTGGSSSYGVYLSTGSVNNTLKNNSITTLAFNVDGIRIQGLATGNRLIDNEITVNGDAYLINSVISSGDKPDNTNITITKPIFYRNGKILLYGNITAVSGANFTLRNVTLLINATSNRTYKIEALSGARLGIFNSNVSGASNLAYPDFFVNFGSHFELKNSHVSRFGHRGGPVSRGIHVSANNVNITNNTIIDQFYGIRLESSNSNVTNNTIDTVFAALDISSGSGHTVSFNVLKGGTDFSRGVISSVQSDSNSYFNNTIIAKPGAGGITIEGVSVSSNAENNAIYNNNITSDNFGIQLLQNADFNRVENNTINGTPGVTLSVANSNLVRGNNITSDGSGIELSASNGNYLLDNLISVPAGKYIVSPGTCCVPSVRNNLTVTKAITYLNGNITLAGNVTVDRSGNLTLNGIILEMNSSSDGEYIVNVSGTLTALHSKFNKTPEAEQFRFYAKENVTIRNSTIDNVLNGMELDGSPKVAIINSTINGINYDAKLTQTTGVVFSNVTSSDGGLSIFFVDTSSSLNFTNTSDGAIFINMTVSQSGEVNRSGIERWSSSRLQWNDTASDLSATYKVSGLEPSSTYSIKKNNVLQESKDSDTNGILSFTTSLDGNTKISLAKVLKPHWFDPSTNTPAKYSTTTDSIFKINWTEISEDSQITIDSVLIEGNWSGVVANYSMSLEEGDAKSGNYSYSAVLPAGTYYWRSYADTTEGTANITEKIEFTIGKADHNIHLAINGTENNYTDGYGNATNATGWLEITQGTSGTTLYRNGTSIGSGSFVEDVVLLGAGYWNYTYTYDESENYTTNSSTLFITITKANPSQYLNLLLNGSSDDMTGTYPLVTNATGYFDGPNGISDLLFELNRNTSGVIGSGTFVSEITSLPGGIHEYVYQTSGGENYTAGSTPGRRVVVEKAPTNLILQINGTRGNRTLNYSESAGISASLNISGKNLTIYAEWTSNNPIHYGITPIELIQKLDVSQGINPGHYRIIANWTGDENYTLSEESWNLTVEDNGAPKWYDVDNDPDSETEYELGKSYTFKINWTDNYEMDTVILNFNGIDHTASLVQGDSLSGNYSVTLTDLGANETGWDYYWKANDTAGNLNQTDVMKYVIRKAQTEVDVLLNGSMEDTTYTYPEPINASANKSFNGGVLRLLMNGTEVGSPVSNNLVSMIGLLGANYYNFSAQLDHQNYTAPQATLFATVNKGDSSQLLNVYIDDVQDNKEVVYPASVTVKGNFSGQGAADLNNLKLWHNSSSPEISSGVTPQVTSAFAAGKQHSFKVNTTGGENWSSGSTIEINLTVLRGPANVTLYLNGTANDNTYNYNSAANITGFANVTGLTVDLYSNWSVDSIGTGTTSATNITRLNSTYNIFAGTYNVSVNTSGNENYTASSDWSFLIILDNEVPSVTLLEPPDDNTWYRNSNHWLNCTATDNVRLSHIELWTNFTEFWEQSGIVATGDVISYQANFSKTVPDGSYSWNCRANDTSSAFSFAAENKTIKVDTVNPSMFPLNPVNYTLVSGTINVNASWSDTISGISTTSFRYENNSFTSEWLALNGTLNTNNLADEEYWIRYNATDVAGNSNTSELRRIIVDNTPPTQLTFVNPTPAHQSVFKFAEFTANISFVESNPSSCLLELNTGTLQNLTMDLTEGSTNYCNRTSTNLPYGALSYKVYVIDEPGNVVVSQTRQLTIDDRAPAFDLIAPANDTLVEFGDSVLLNVSWFDEFSNLNISILETNETGVMENKTVYGSPITHLNTKSNWSNFSWSGSNPPESLIMWRVWTNDTNGTHSTLNVSNAARFRIVDVIAPSVTLLTPPDNVWQRQSTLYYNCTATDNYQLSHISLYGTFSGDWREEQIFATGPVATMQANFSKNAADGTYVWNCRANDTSNVANFSLANWTVKIDTVNPNTGSTLSGTLGNAQWYISDVDVTLSCADPSPGSGCSGSSYRVYPVDGTPGAWQSGTSLTVNAEGNNTVEFNSTDIAGNTEATKKVYVAIDTRLPSTAITKSPASPNGNSGWYVTQPVTFDLACSDPTPGSGCSRTSYRINSGAWTTQAPPIIEVLVAVEGNNTINYNSTDVAGNIENTLNHYIPIDTVAPTSFVETKPTGDNQWFNSTPQFVNFSCSDATSLCRQLNYSIDGSTEWTVRTASPQSELWINESLDLADGNHTVDYAFRDLAGNVESVKRVYVAVDRTIPNIVQLKGWRSPSGAQVPDNTWQNYDDALYYNWTNASSVSGNKYYFTQGPNPADPDINSPSTTELFVDNTTTPFNQGTNITKIRPRTNSGVWGQTRSFTLKYDNTDPTVIPILPEDESYVSGVIQVSASWSDLLSGIKNHTFRWEEIPFQSGPYINLNGTLDTTELEDGDYKIRYSVGDNAGNLNDEETVDIIVDNTAPQDITFVSKTPPNNSLLKFNNYIVNVTFIESNPRECKLELNNGTVQNLSMTLNDIQFPGFRDFCNITVTDQPEGLSRYKVYVIDVAGGTNVSKENHVTIDITPPNFTQILPANGTVLNYGSSIKLNVSWADSYSNLSRSILSTNESGLFANLTTYGSPVSHLNTKSNWSNFTWDNLDITPPNVIAWRVWTNDTNGTHGDFNVSEIRYFIVTDIEAPKWSNNKTNPNSPVVYSETGQYEFNITWTDNYQVAEVYFEFDGTNFTFTSEQITRTGTASNAEYNITLGPIPAKPSGYKYRWYAKDTLNNMNKSDEWTYVVNRAGHNIHLEIDGTETDKEYVFETETNATGYLEISQAKNLAVLRLNGTQIVTDSPATHVATLGAGRWNYTYIYPQSQNYTENSSTRFVTITQAPTTINVLLEGENVDRIYTYPDFVNATTNKSVENGNLTLWRNGTLVMWGPGAHVTNVSQLKASVYNYSAQLNHQNYTAEQATRIATMNKGPTSVNLTVNGSDENPRLVIIGSHINITAAINVSGVRELSITSNFTGGDYWRNRTGPSPLTNITNTTLLLSGIYYLNGSFDGDENYTASHDDALHIDLQEEFLNAPNNASLSHIAEGDNERQNKINVSWYYTPWQNQDGFWVQRNRSGAEERWIHVPGKNIRSFVDTGLSTDQNYSYGVVAYRDDPAENSSMTVANNSDAENGLNKYRFTPAQLPGAPVVNGETLTSIRLEIDRRTNPDHTEFAVQVCKDSNDFVSCPAGLKFVQPNGVTAELVDTVQWAQFSGFNGADGIEVINLESGVYYFRARANNTDFDVTPWSESAGAATGTISPNAPEIAFDPERVHMPERGNLRNFLRITNKGTETEEFTISVITKVNAEVTLSQEKITLGSEEADWVGFDVIYTGGGEGRVRAFVVGTDSGLNATDDLVIKPAVFGVPGPGFAEILVMLFMAAGAVFVVGRKKLR